MKSLKNWWDSPAYLSQLLSRPAIRMKLKPEDRLTIEVADMLRKASTENRLNCVWFHVGNEGKRSKLNGAIQKAKGVIPGVYDFAFLSRDMAAAIELKAGGSLNDNQKAFRRWCDDLGVRRATCRSVPQVEDCLQIWGLLNRCKS